jgi:hypothetical protein
MSWLSNLKASFLGDKSTQNQNPPVIEGAGQTFSAPEEGSAPYVHQTAYGTIPGGGPGWTRANDDMVQVWANQNHRPGPPPDQPPENWSGYHQDPAMVTEPNNTRDLITKPVPSTNPGEVGFRTSPYANPEAFTFERTNLLHRPTTWEYWRDMTQDGGERFLNGSHFSMADNHRTYPLGGMQAARERNLRNTYRVQPQPWDESIVDIPTQSSGVPQVYFDTPQADMSSRGYRLG